VFWTKNRLLFFRVAVTCACACGEAPQPIPVQTALTLILITAKIQGGGDEYTNRLNAVPY